MEKKQLLEVVQGNMTLMAALGAGVEHLIGRGATSIAFRAGRNAGLQRRIDRQEKDLLKAIEVVQEEVLKVMNWTFKPYKKKSDRDLITEDEDFELVKLVFSNCLTRSCQLIYGYPQKSSLCQLNHGVFCGLMQQVYGTMATYEFIHSGENACIGVLKVRKSRRT